MECRRFNHTGIAATHVLAVQLLAVKVEYKGKATRQGGAKVESCRSTGTEGNFTVLSTEEGGRT